VPLISNSNRGKYRAEKNSTQPSIDRSISRRKPTLGALSLDRSGHLLKSFFAAIPTVLVRSRRLYRTATFRRALRSRLSFGPRTFWVRYKESRIYGFRSMRSSWRTRFEEETSYIRYYGGPKRIKVWDHQRIQFLNSSLPSETAESGENKLAMTRRIQNCILMVRVSNATFNQYRQIVAGLSSDRLIELWESHEIYSVAKIAGQTNNGRQFIQLWLSEVSGRTSMTGE